MGNRLKEKLILSPGENRTLYLRLALFTLAFIIVISLFLSLALTKTFERILLTQLYRENAEHLYNASRKITETSEIISNLTFRTYYEEFSRSLLNGIPSLPEQVKLLHQLSSVSDTVSFIDSVYLYNAGEHTLFVGSGYQDKVQSLGRDGVEDRGFSQILEVRDTLRMLSPLPRITEILRYDSTVTKAFYSYLFYDWLRTGEEGRSFIMVNVPVNSFSRFVRIEGADTLIVDSGGVVISDISSTYPMMTNLGGEDAFLQALQDREQGYYLGELRGEKVLIVYTDVDVQGWKYIRIFSYAGLFQDIDTLRKKILGFSSILLAAIILVSLLLVTRAFRPVKDITAKITFLEKERKMNSVQLRMSVLRDLLLGRNRDDEKTPAERLNDYGINYDEKMLFCVFNVYLASGSREEDLGISFSGEALGREILQIDKNGSIKTVILSSKTVDSPDFLAAMNRVFSRTLSRMNRNNSPMIVHIFGSQIRQGISSLPEMFSQVGLCEKYRILFPEQRIVVYEEVLRREEEHFSYPEPEEKKIVQYIAMGDYTRACEASREILYRSSLYSLVDFSFLVSRLSYALNSIIGNQISLNYDSQSADPRIYSLDITREESLETLADRFIRAITLHGENIRRNAYNRNNNLVKSIQDYISEEFSNPRLSLDLIADEVGLSVAYMERVYKKQYGSTINDFLINARLDCSLRLLEETDLTIDEISCRVGYNYASYFSNAFKRRYGSSPGNYRKNRK